MTTRPALAVLVSAGLAGCGSSTSISPGGAVTADASPLAPDGAAPAPDGLFQPVDGLFQPADALPAGRGAMIVDWAVQYVGSTRPVSCDQAGTPTVVLGVTPSGGPPIPTGAPCDSQRLTTQPLAPGRYDVRIELRDVYGVGVSTHQGLFDVQPGSVTDLGIVIFEVQSFQLAWSLSRGGQLLTCAAAGATRVELTTHLDGGREATYTFPCADGQAASPAVQVGSYLLAIRLLGAGGATLWQSAMPFAFNVSADQRAVLPPVVFTL
jgi:hypothetical protein